MKVKILAFGNLTRFIEKETQLELPSPATLAQVREGLFASYPTLKSLSFQFALNEEMVQSFDAQIRDGDIIALLPPFAGG